MPSRLIRRHDQFFRRLLDQPGAAGALIRERLPAAVAELLAPGAPELVPGSFVDGELREYRTDRLYRVRTLEGDTAFIYTLIEHKSSPDPGIRLQLLGYMTRIWKWWEKHEGRGPDGERRSLPPILPLVVYHGDAEWRMPLDFVSGIDLKDNALRPYLLDFRYSLTDLGRIDDRHLSDEETLRIGLLILKHGSRDGDLRQTLLTLGRVAATLGFDDLVALVRYILVEPGEIEAALLRDVLKEIMPGQEARIMSIAVEQWKAEGKAEGIQIGKAVGKAEGKADMLLRFLRLRFGVVPETTLATVMGASEDQLNEWAEKVFDASTLEGVFAERRAN